MVPSEKMAERYGNPFKVHRENQRVTENQIAVY